MLLMVEGSVSEVRPVWQNALPPMVSTPSGMVALFRLAQRLNVDSSISVIPSGITTLSKPDSQKALLPMEVSDEGNLTDLMPSQR